MATNVLAAGTTLGSYRIERLVGSGQMGQVYAATHVGLQKRVALKVLAREWADDPTIRQRFLREGRAAARVRHDHIIEVFDVGVAGDLPFLAMELLEGQSLSERYALGPMPVEDLVGIMLPVLAAVATAHEAGIVHRDLKPENVFLRRDARRQIHPVVLDFGLSQIADERSLNLTDTNSKIGTPQYMSPEQVRRPKNVSAATDQYALGVIMYEGAVGELPFDGKTVFEVLQKITSGAHRAVGLENRDLPDGLGKVINRAMSFEIDARYPDLWALGRDLLPLAAPRDQETWRPVFTQKPGRFKMPESATAEAGGRRRPSRALVVTIALAVVAIAAAALLVAAR